jgi:3-oxoacyl-[acyl-carrier protein] reductase
MKTPRQRVLLTGGSGGIGSAILKTLSAEEYDVVAPSSRELDLSDEDSVFRWIEINKSTEFHAMVLSAGVNYPEILFSEQESKFGEINQVNFLSHQTLLKTFVPKMAHKGYGRIVAISSAYSTTSREGRSAYSISKASLESLIRSIAVEYGRLNVLANCVVPGFIDTALTRKNNSTEQIDQLVTRIPLNSLGQPKDVARAVKFLLDPDNTYVTGQKIIIDGGYSIN